MKKKQRTKGRGIMRRRIEAPSQETPAYQALVDHKLATLNVLLARIPDVSTFAQLGELVGYSHEWVRQRLIRAPEKLYKNGKRYKVPKGVAEDFVRSVFN
jgi:hypothetical protein